MLDDESRRNERMRYAQYGALQLCILPCNSGNAPGPTRQLHVCLVEHD